MAAGRASTCVSFSEFRGRDDIRWLCLTCYPSDYCVDNNSVARSLRFFDFPSELACTLFVEGTVSLPSVTLEYRLDYAIPPSALNLSVAGRRRPSSVSACSASIEIGSAN